jgi:hypothetical protein
LFGVEEEAIKNATYDLADGFGEVEGVDAFLVAAFRLCVKC